MWSVEFSEDAHGLLSLDFNSPTCKKKAKALFMFIYFTELWCVSVCVCLLVVVCWQSPLGGCVYSLGMSSVWMCREKKTGKGLRSPSAWEPRGHGAGIDSINTRGSETSTSGQTSPNRHTGLVSPRRARKASDL